MSEKFVNQNGCFQSSKSLRWVLSNAININCTEFTIVWRNYESGIEVKGVMVTFGEIIKIG